VCFVSRVRVFRFSCGVMQVSLCMRCSNMEQHQCAFLFGVCFLATGRRTRTPSDSSADESVVEDPDAAPSGLGGVPPPMTPPATAWRAAGAAASEDEFDGKAAGVWADSEEIQVECEGNDSLDANAASTAGKGRGRGAHLLCPKAKIRATPRVLPTHASQRPAVKLHPRPPAHPPPAAKQQRVVARVVPPPPPPPPEMGSLDLPIGCRICNECGQCACWRKGECFNEECVLYKGTGRCR